MYGTESEDLVVLVEYCGWKPVGDVAAFSDSRMKSRRFKEGWVRPEVVYEHFKRMDPKDFSGTTDLFVAEGWIRSLEVIFKFMDMEDAGKVRCTTYLLKDNASLWWERAEKSIDLNTLTWEGFKKIFYEKYFTVDVRSRVKREFMSLRQGDLIVAEYVQKFDRGVTFCL
ncbi:hypothetical protein ZIOFF_017108 [Zingiber officinale]|uniref:Retrotransposon gag domain-containing protein n=1 Tax=Zingiber officinale TaxID=94328 RepID=A0A8J5LI38_ZINOF|nr:hypothetical protein ZIOFF_017108 [Zingiber officinale]